MLILLMIIGFGCTHTVYTKSKKKIEKGAFSAHKYPEYKSKCYTYK